MCFGVSAAGGALDSPATAKSFPLLDDCKEIIPRKGRLTSHLIVRSFRPVRARRLCRPADVSGANLRARCTLQNEFRREITARENIEANRYRYRIFFLFL